MTMPGLPKVPSRSKIDLVDGKVVGIVLISRPVSGGATKLHELNDLAVLAGASERIIWVNIILSGTTRW